jgi:hypothetical protein
MSAKRDLVATLWHNYLSEVTGGHMSWALYWLDQLAAQLELMGGEAYVAQLGRNVTLAEIRGLDDAIVAADRRARKRLNDATRLRYKRERVADGPGPADIPGPEGRS